MSDSILNDLDAMPIPLSTKENLKSFFSSYLNCAEKRGVSEQHLYPLLTQYLKEIQKAYQGEFTFGFFHKAQRKPIDFYQMGIDFFLPILDMEESTLQGIDQLVQIEKQKAKGENVILLANHQVEPDPQLLSCLLNERFSTLAEEMVFIAGERVIKDPLSIPLSWGRFLLCIHSKKHFSSDSQVYEQQKEHNKKAIFTLSALLSEGGKVLYVAPSGGRDRVNSKGKLEPAPFDPDVIEMLYLLSKKAKTPTHFYPLALKTAVILPPPKDVEIEIGEKRHTEGGAIHAIFGEEVDMEAISTDSEKKVRKRMRADSIYGIVKELYME